MKPYMESQEMNAYPTNKSDEKESYNLRRWMSESFIIQG